MAPITNIEDVFQIIIFAYIYAFVSLTTLIKGKMIHSKIIDLIEHTTLILQEYFINLYSLSRTNTLYPFKYFKKHFIIPYILDYLQLGIIKEIKIIRTIADIFTATNWIRQRIAEFIRYIYLAIHSKRLDIQSL